MKDNFLMASWEEICPKVMKETMDSEMMKIAFFMIK
jgi:hypothetical protein